MKREERETSHKPCKFYLQGECKFGKRCRFSHVIVEVYLMRHAQSVYNELLQNSQFDAFSPEAKEKYQMNTELIDCSITEAGKAQVNSLQLPSELYKLNLKFDLIFVSPLQRALQTLHLTMKIHKIRARKVIVIPEMTEVVSKMCDFTSGLKQKQQRYPKFDFSRLEKLEEVKECWQDDFVDDEYKHAIIQNEKYGKRYTFILDQIFPTPLEGSRQCFKRTIRGINEIKNICLEEKANRIFIISHNRTLKCIMGRDYGGKAESFDNCQIKTTLF